MSTKLHIYIIKMVQFIENSSLKSEWTETWIFFFCELLTIRKNKTKMLEPDKSCYQTAFRTVLQ